MSPSSPIRRLLFILARALAWTLFAVLGPMRVKGRGRIPKTGGLLVLSNHISDLDPILVQFGCPREIRFMAKQELFEMPKLLPFLQWFRAFPVRRDRPDLSSIKLSIKLLKAGEVVCVFPEGQISEDAEMQEVKGGAALIAKLADVPVICCGLSGAERILPYGTLKPRPSFHFTHISWGEPRTFGVDAKPEELATWCDAQLRTLSSNQ